MVTFIDAQRETYGVEPISAVVPIAPSTYYAHKAWQANPRLRSGRAQRDAWLKDQIRRVRDENFAGYGAYKVWRQLNREGIARGPVHRRTPAAGAGPAWHTFVAERSPLRPVLTPPRGRPTWSTARLWPRAPTHSGWRTSPSWRPGAVSSTEAFVIDVFARSIVGWSVSSSLRTDLALDALEQALYARPGDCTARC